MATPVGHSLAGFAAYTLFACPSRQCRIALTVSAIVMANAPDLDFIPGILVGKPALYHQGITHSVGSALLISLLAALVLQINKVSVKKGFLVCFFAYLSHLVLDLFGPDERPPYGIPLLWPISSKYFISPVSIFLGVHHAGTSSTSTLEWIRAIFHPYNLGAIAVEILLATLLVLLARKLAKHVKPKSQSRYV